MLKKTKEGKYTEEQLKGLSPEQLIKLLIQETSYQDTMNVIRKEFK